MAMVRQLEAMLTPGERRVRAAAFEKLRVYVHRVALQGGIGVRTKTFPFRAVGGIRVDLEVLKGIAAVAEQKPGN